MNNKNALTPCLIHRVIGVLKSRRLRRFKGTDIAEIERKVRDYYISLSSSDYYDELSTVDLWADTARRKGFVNLCEKAEDIMDFGCGTGGLAAALAAKCPRKKIHAVDIGTSSGKLLRHEANVNFVRASVLDVPWADCSIDLVISRFVIEHVTRPRELLAEAFRILRPGGILYLLYPQLLLKVDFFTAMIELFNCIFKPNQLTYLDPQIGELTSDTDDQDAVWITSPFRVSWLAKSVGFQIVGNVPTQSLVILRKP
ncbi:MAG: methyltransferase domain-containing protein [Kiritimatiellae bacterium]|nr:methyltransferase domain-containing protein [Kiritimatiellia bacterium]